MSNAISGVAASQASAIQQATQIKKDSDGDNDGSKSSASLASSIGPAFVVSLSNTAHASAPDMAQGDPDHDGK